MFDVADTRDKIATPRLHVQGKGQLGGPRSRRLCQHPHDPSCRHCASQVSEVHKAKFLRVIPQPHKGHAALVPLEKDPLGPPVDCTGGTEGSGGPKILSPSAEGDHFYFRYQDRRCAGGGCLRLCARVMGPRPEPRLSPTPNRFLTRQVLPIKASECACPCTQPLGQRSAVEYLQMYIDADEWQWGQINNARHMPRGGGEGGLEWKRGARPLDPGPMTS